MKGPWLVIVRSKSAKKDAVFARSSPSCACQPTTVHSGGARHCLQMDWTQATKCAKHSSLAISAVTRACSCGRRAAPPPSPPASCCSAQASSAASVSPAAASARRPPVPTATLYANDDAFPAGALPASCRSTSSPGRAPPLSRSSARAPSAMSGAENGSLLGGPGPLRVATWLTAQGAAAAAPLLLPSAIAARQMHLWTGQCESMQLVSQYSARRQCGQQAVAPSFPQAAQHAPTIAVHA
mmetsp:Transcript_76435/g.216105  ORF Transcript_76435/g.216105 Transcript_76435/m.216105 type:complete len:240 (+) Transcript_76435:983-1702(+)